MRARFPKDTEIITTLSSSTLAGRLQQLSKQVARLIPDRRDPERFFEERSEVAYELREIADQMTLDKKSVG